MVNSASNYSIKDLETLSGIKSHTIRIWEQRFNLLRPVRSATNIRSYSNNDLKKILNISFLNRNGFKISSIAEMNEEQIREAVIELSAAKPGGKGHIQTLEEAMLQLDEAAFLKVLSNVEDTMGMENGYVKVVIPFFEKIGLMWQTGTINPAQEHFASNLIRQKIISVTDQLEYKPGANSQRIALLLPEHELHEITLLFLNYSLRKRKMNTLYLGQSVPWSSLERIVSIFKPEFIVASFTNTLDPGFLKRTLFELQQVFKGKTFLSGKAFDSYKGKLPTRTYLFNSLNELLQKVKAER